ncbi:MAG TPA: phasin family protein [Steroidobacteraceae bacterium]|nr:phasin family protein [Steroidobacteraceae bacterium]
MTLAGQIALNAARRFRERAEGYAGRALRAAQRSAAQAAEHLETAEPQIATLTEAGLRFTELSYRCVDRLLRQSIASAQGALTDGAQRLRATAKAESLQALYAAQRASLPASRERLVRELEATWRIVAAAGREVAALAESTGRELRHGRGTPPKRRRRGASPARSRGKIAPGAG